MVCLGRDERALDAVASSADMVSGEPANPRKPKPTRNPNGVAEARRQDKLLIRTTASTDRDAGMRLHHNKWILAIGG